MSADPHPSSSPARPAPLPRAAFTHFEPMPLRWMDCDVYGHVNNVVYYSYFDTAVNRYLTQAGVLDALNGPVIGLVVETGCHYFAPITFPDEPSIGLRVAHIGRSSVRYELAVFSEGAHASSAQGHFVHVYVDRERRRPAEVPEAMRAALARLRPAAARP
ncbi:4-hydroxybenzoyl-CoA thioesterase [Bordetella ansorpii]|uniref:4-hydroxybenzoyl-CoA thioesterase n=2 Tax=Bordetella ansorpii TaxID=288768 RepID=A0A157SGV7_9BORD|nr:4-hydroxybenzoyl-CoA thioesterase [Bordetella ansorpii]